MAFDIITRQAIITGTVRDAVTAEGTRSPIGLRLSRNSDGARLPHLGIRMSAGGTFVVHGDPARILDPQDIDIRLEFSARGYQPQAQVVTFTAAELARVDDPFSVGTEVLSARTISGAPKTLTVDLAPEPVSLRGRVVRAEDPSQPISGADVSVTSPVAIGPFSTLGDGTFAISPLPVAQNITLEITAAGRVPYSADFRPDYRQPINQGRFALEEI